MVYTMIKHLDIYSHPHPDNFCGGAFQDWLEVNLLSKCNGKCSWCVERDGYHPDEVADWHTIADQALASGKTNIILLGGEPTLYPDLRHIVLYLHGHGRKVWVTTNGGILTPEFVREKLLGITGINISIHDFDPIGAKRVMGFAVKNLKGVVRALHEIGASVRFNCNCISGHIDDIEQVRKYVAFAHAMGADKVRFAELKIDEENFVDLAKVFNYKLGLNDDPFVHGCIRDVIIAGMPVNIRQMCGLQTSKRPKPINPKQHEKTVLYYDGKFYDGWQTKESGSKNMKNDKALIRILNLVATGELSSQRAKELINDIDDDKKNESVPVVHVQSGAGCAY